MCCRRSLSLWDERMLRLHKIIEPKDLLVSMPPDRTASHIVSFGRRCFFQYACVPICCPYSSTNTVFGSLIAGLWVNTVKFTGTQDRGGCCSNPLRWTNAACLLNNRTEGFVPCNEFEQNSIQPHVCSIFDHRCFFQCILLYACVTVDIVFVHCVWFLCYSFMDE